MSSNPLCPASAPFFGFIGAAVALVFSNVGAAYGSASWLSKANRIKRTQEDPGLKLHSQGALLPGLGSTDNPIFPVIMAGVLSIYGLIVAVIIAGKVQPPFDAETQYSAFTGYAHLAAGLVCGLSTLAAGMAIGIVSDTDITLTSSGNRVNYFIIAVHVVVALSLALVARLIVVGLIVNSQASKCS